MDPRSGKDLGGDLFRGTGEGIVPEKEVTAPPVTETANEKFLVERRSRTRYGKGHKKPEKVNPYAGKMEQEKVEVKRISLIPQLDKQSKHLNAWQQFVHGQVRAGALGSLYPEFPPKGWMPGMNPFLMVPHAEEE